MAITNALDPVAGQPQQGDWQFDGVFGVDSASSVSISGSDASLMGASGVTVTATTGALALSSGDGLVSITAPSQFTVSTPAFDITCSAISVTGSTTIDFAASVNVTGLTAATQDNILYIDSATGALTREAAPVSFNTASNWTVTGDWDFQGGFQINSTASVISIVTDDEITLDSLGITRILPGVLEITAGTSTLVWGANSLITYGADTAIIVNDMTVTVNGVMAWTLNDTLSFGGGTVTFVNGIGLNTGATISWNAPPSGVASQVLYYDSGTDAVTVGAAPTTRLNYQGIPGTTQALVADQAYITAAGTLTTCTLPATAAVGDTFVVVGESVGLFRIAQNAGQSIRLGGSVSTSGVTGYVDSVGQGAVIEIVCTITDTNFMVVDSIGNFNVV
jgi:hypothetical protein